MTTRRTAEEWRALVEAWLASGQRCDVFAEETGVRASQLGWWRWKLGLSAPSKSEPTRFLDVVVTTPVPQRLPPDLLVEVGAVRVRVPAGFDACELRRLVDALC